MVTNLSFVSNTVKGIQTISKRFRFVILQEIHNTLVHQKSME